MNISEEMKKRAKEVDNLPFEEKTTGAYDLTSFVPKVEALEIENENFDNENRLLKQQNKELIEFIEKCIIKKRGRWGTYHYELSFQKGDYQKINKITGDTKNEIIKKILMGLILLKMKNMEKMDN